MAASLYVAQLLDNPEKYSDHRVQIVHPMWGITVVGFMNSAFNLNISPSWEMNDGNFAGLANRVGAEAQGLLGDEGSGTTQLMSYASSIAHWQSTPRPSYPVDFTIVAYRSDIDVRKVYRDLAKCVLPEGSGAMTVKTPAGYRVSAGNTISDRKYVPDGTLDLRIGNWFYQRGLIMTSLSGTFSREVVPSGAPLYLECSLSLTPFRMIDAQDMESALQGSAGGASAGGA